MQHLDEGTIHAWLDGALSANEAARVEQHIKSCAECAASVAEARGLVAASSRIVSALDVTPSGVIPAFGARKKPTRRWWIGSAAAATILLAATTMLTLKGHVEPVQHSVSGDSMSIPAPKPLAPRQTEGQNAPAPLAAGQDVSRDSATRFAQAPKSATGPTAGHSAPINRTQADRVASSTANDIRPGGGTARMAAVKAPATPAPVAATISPDSGTIGRLRGRSASEVSRVVGAADVPATAIGQLTAPRTARAPTTRAAAQQQRGAEPAPAGEMKTAATAAGAGSPVVLAGCYEVDASTDVLPRRFALLSSRDGEARQVRYVDSTGVLDGNIPDVSWSEANGRITIRTSARGDVLFIDRSGQLAISPGVVSANSPLGPRTVRTITCRP